MKDKTELKRRKAIRTKQINKLLKERGHKSPEAYKRYIDEVRAEPWRFPGKEFAASSTFRNLIDGKSIESDNLELYADDLGASTDYLLGRSAYLQVGNQEIAESTGLTDESIEKLKRISSLAAEASPSNDPATYAKALIDCLNLILESTHIKTYAEPQRVRDESQPEYEQVLDNGLKVIILPTKEQAGESFTVSNPILGNIYGYIFNHPEGMTEFENPDSGDTRILSKASLYRTYLKDQIFIALEALREKIEV